MKKSSVEIFRYKVIGHVNFVPDAKIKMEKKDVRNRRSQKWRILVLFLK